MLTRRQFLGSAAAVAAAPAFAVGPPPRGPGFPLTVISGKPRERGKLYGRTFKDAIAAFVDKEIYKAFLGKPSPKPAMLRYAAACAKEVRGYSPEVYAEMEGLAEGAGLRLEEVVLLSLHEELWHKGVLPAVGHCTAVAVGPPDTADEHGYVGQTWDWMRSVFGLSSVLHWKRAEGPSVLAYAYPGLWVGAGLNSAGVALCWTSGAGLGIRGPRVGVPSYALLTHLLYQPTLKDVVKEAKRATHAGWFTFVLADGKGHLLNVEGSPKGLAVEEPKGALARVGFGTRGMAGTAPGAAVKLHPRCQKTYDLLASSKGKTTRATLQHYFASPKCGISVGNDTLDMMVFDTTAKEAHLSRGPSYGARWQKFTFGG